MYHTRTHHFYPFISQFFGRTLPDQTHIDFNRRFGEWKKTWTKAYFDVGFLENFSQEMLYGSFQVRERHILANDQPFNLTIFGFVCYIRRLIAKNLSWHYHAIRWGDTFLNLRFHVPHLYRCGMSS